MSDLKNEIILYQPDEATEHIEVRLRDETVWLNRNQMAMLFGRDVKTIGKHINNVFNEGELEKAMVVAKFATTTKHGAIEGKSQSTLTKHYSLDVIISVGYRVKSKQGTQFRIWATHVLRDYLLKGYVLNKRMNRIGNSFEAKEFSISHDRFELNALNGEVVALANAISENFKMVVI